jgi:hypothetical protein
MLNFGYLMLHGRESSLFSASHVQHRIVPCSIVTPIAPLFKPQTAAKIEKNNKNRPAVAQR